MTSGTSSPTPTDSPSLSQRPLLLTTSVQQIRKTVEFVPDSSEKMSECCGETKRDPER